MNMNKYWVRIPVGSNPEHKAKYVEDILSLFPDNSVSRLEMQWEKFRQIGIIQIIYDIRDASAIATMTATQYGQKWDLSNDFIRSIPTINEFIPPIDDLEDSMFYDSGFSEREYDDRIFNKDNEIKSKEIVYDVDAILDKITLSGYDSLNIGEKKFLDSLKNK